MHIAAFVVALFAGIISIVQGANIASYGNYVEDIGAWAGHAGAEEAGGIIAGLGFLVFVSGVVSIVGGVLSLKKKKLGWKLQIAACVICVFAAITDPMGLGCILFYVAAGLLGFFAIHKFDMNEIIGLVNPTEENKYKTRFAFLFIAEDGNFKAKKAFWGCLAVALVFFLWINYIWGVILLAPLVALFIVNRNNWKAVKAESVKSSENSKD